LSQRKGRREVRLQLRLPLAERLWIIHRLVAFPVRRRDAAVVDQDVQVAAEEGGRFLNAGADGADVAEVADAGGDASRNSLSGANRRRS